MSQGWSLADDSSATRPSHSPKRALCWVLVLATLVRLVSYNGSFGSDDVTYFYRALDVAQGRWSSADYNGALRYGFNLPVGILIWLLGPSDWVANLWPLLCSVLEVALVYLLGHSIGGAQLALTAGILIATAPLQVAVSTRIHTDPIVAYALCAAFACLYWGTSSPRARKTWLLASGVALGGVFWAKELAAVTYFAFLPLALYFKRSSFDLLWIGLGLACMLFLNGLLMLWIAGDPLHQITTVVRQLRISFIGAGAGEDSPAYYLWYLVVDLRHVGLLGLLAFYALCTYPFEKRHGGGTRAKVFAIGWLLVLLSVLSLFPVSLSPLRFAMKQSNYVSLFMAPLALVAALGVVRLPRLARITVLWMVAIFGISLSLFQQADYRAFSSNSRALSTWAQSHPEARVFGTRNNASLGTHLLRLRSPDAHPILHHDALNGLAGSLGEVPADRIVVLLDPLTAGWPRKQANLVEALDCWKLVEVLQPEGLATGNYVAGMLSEVFRATGPMGLHARLSSLAHPESAQLFEVPVSSPTCQRL